MDFKLLCLFNLQNLTKNSPDEEKNPNEALNLKVSRILVNDDDEKKDNTKESSDNFEEMGTEDDEVVEDEEPVEIENSEEQKTLGKFEEQLNFIKKRSIKEHEKYRTPNEMLDEKILQINYKYI